jgi:periplasmic divalent cation tolerance protein
MIEPLLVLTTLGNAEQGKKLAAELVDLRLAACVTCMPNLTSYYRWSGRVEEDSEILLMIKTTSERLETLKAHLLRVHPYQVPEFLVVAVADGGEPFLKWLAESTSPAPHES